MKSPKKSILNVSTLIIGASILFWIILIFDPLNFLNGQSCHVSADATASISFSGLMIGWVIMVLAMMLPKLISPIEDICQSSLKRKRVSSSLLFIGGYTLVWTLVGILMNLIILEVNKSMPGSYLPAIIIGSIALVWQFSPIKQRFLNLGHDHRTIKAFGTAADIDALKFGVEHGLWCLGSGWAIMWFPMLLPIGHNLAMLLVMFIMVSEHMEHPQKPAWRLDFRMKLWRIIKAQTKIKLGYSLYS